MPEIDSRSATAPDEQVHELVGACVRSGALPVGTRHRTVGPG